VISGGMGEKDDITGSLGSPVYSNSKYAISVNNWNYNYTPSLHGQCADYQVATFYCTLQSLHRFM